MPQRGDHPILAEGIAEARIDISDVLYHDSRSEASSVTSAQANALIEELAETVVVLLLDGEDSLGRHRARACVLR